MLLLMDKMYSSLSHINFEKRTYLRLGYSSFSQPYKSYFSPTPPFFFFLYFSCFNWRSGSEGTQRQAICLSITS